MRVTRLHATDPRGPADTLRPMIAALLLCAAATPSAAKEAPPQGIAPTTTETIRQRDNAGRVRVEREVRLNEAGDYVNHGVWRSWDARGKLDGQGRYAWGKPSGPWTRWVDRDASPLLETAPFHAFTPPFLSQATFSEGRIEGAWSIYDADGRRCCEVSFRSGQRHGVASLWDADGGLYRRSRFEAGRPTGQVEQRGADGELAVIADYVAGRRRIEREERHADGRRKAFSQWLGPLTVAAEPDDFWRLALAHYETRGEELRHGERLAWWPNGQEKLRLTYEMGEAVGPARWWNENGQLALRGAYRSGLATGRWTWWHANGARAADCRYTAGRPDGELASWAADGSRIAPEDQQAGRLELAGRPAASVR